MGKRELSRETKTDKKTKQMKTLIAIIGALILLAFCSYGAALNTRGLVRVESPALVDAREFFNWEVNKFPVFNSEGKPISGFNEFRSTKGNTLHVGNETYNPAQPLVAFDQTTKAIDEMSIPYKVKSVGSWDNDANIFAQFALNPSSNYTGSKFEVNGKEYNGFITMAKGNDSTLPLTFWLTVICIVCRNIWRMALDARAKGDNVTVKQTKNSANRVNEVYKEIIALFKVQETVKQTLERMAREHVTVDDAKRAFLTLIGSNETVQSKTGKTGTENRLERYMAEFKNPAMGTNGETREDWFNAVTYVNTHGNKESKTYDADKAFVSSMVGKFDSHKSKAFAMASTKQTFDKAIREGELLETLLNRPVTIGQLSSTEAASEMNRLLAKS